MANKKQRQLAVDLRLVLSRLIKKLRSRTVAIDQLSLTERSVLKQLDLCHSVLPGQLAAAEKVTNQAMSQILNKLANKQLIAKQISETDKRKVLISLSAAGKEYILQSRNERDEWLADALAHTFSKEEQTMLQDLIAPLKRLVDF